MSFEQSVSVGSPKSMISETFHQSVGFEFNFRDFLKEEWATLASPLPVDMYVCEAARERLVLAV